MGARDPHRLEAKPSFISRASQADLWLAIGLELEVGYEPPILNESRNPKIQRGAPGHVDVADWVKVREVPTGQVTRAEGDLHPYGNPHLWLDPYNGRAIALKLAEKMGSLDRANAAFYEANAKLHLSAVDQSYMAGLLQHAREICAVTNQWVNSYKRLVSGYEAPVYVCWANRNRSALVRVPMYKPGKEKATRLELRSPDPACNPYLAFAVMLAAGLDGIERKLELAPGVVDDVYEMSETRRAELGIGQLPENLRQATDVLEGSELMRDALGAQVHDWIVRNQRLEWHEYRTRVTPWELESYLPIL